MSTPNETPPPTQPAVEAEAANTVEQPLPATTAPPPYSPPETANVLKSDPKSVTITFDLPDLTTLKVPNICTITVIASVAQLIVLFFTNSRGFSGMPFWCIGTVIGASLLTTQGIRLSNVPERAQRVLFAATVVIVSASLYNVAASAYLSGYARYGNGVQFFIVSLVSLGIACAHGVGIFRSLFVHEETPTGALKEVDGVLRNVYWKEIAILTFITWFSLVQAPDRGQYVAVGFSVASMCGSVLFLIKPAQLTIQRLTSVNMLRLESTMATAFLIFALLSGINCFSLNNYYINMIPAGIASLCAAFCCLQQSNHLANVTSVATCDFPNASNEKKALGEVRVV
jgi:hypothetical protein